MRKEPTPRILVLFPAYLHPSSEIRKLAAECQTPDESHRGESCRLSLQLWFCYEPFVPRVWTSFQSLVSLWGRGLWDSSFHIKYVSGSARVRGGSVVSLTFLCCLIFVLWRRNHDWDEVIVKNRSWSRNSSSVTPPVYIPESVQAARVFVHEHKLVLRMLWGLGVK